MRGLGFRRSWCCPKASRVRGPRRRKGPSRFFSERCCWQQVRLDTSVSRVTLASAREDAAQRTDRAAGWRRRERERSIGHGRKGQPLYETECSILGSVSAFSIQLTGPLPALSLLVSFACFSDSVYSHPVLLQSSCRRCRNDIKIVPRRAHEAMDMKTIARDLEMCQRPAWS